MQPVANTPEILYRKVINEGVDDVWVQWAIDMLEAGYDTEHLRILAGETKPFNQWYLQPLTDKVFSELGMDITDVTGIKHTYFCLLIGEALHGTKSYNNVLCKLYNIYCQQDLEETLFDFYLLYFTMKDLQDEEVQYYWP